jgi:hypothetical protein
MSAPRRIVFFIIVAGVIVACHRAAFDPPSANFFCPDSSGCQLRWYVCHALHVARFVLFSTLHVFAPQNELAHAAPRQPHCVMLTHVDTRNPLVLQALALLSQLFYSSARVGQEAMVQQLQWEVQLERRVMLLALR